MWCHSSVDTGLYELMTNLSTPWSQPLPLTMGKREPETANATSPVTPLSPFQFTHGSADENNETVELVPASTVNHTETVPVFEK